MSNDNPTTVDPEGSNSVLDAEEADWAARSGPVEVRYLPGRGPDDAEKNIHAALRYIQARYGAPDVDTSTLEV